MVGIEKNSSEDFAAALKTLPSGVIDGLRGVTSEVSCVLATIAPAMSELAEAALAYTHDATAHQPAALTLVADNGEGVITEEDAKALVDAVTQICTAEGVPPSEMATLVARAKNSVGGNKSTLESIRAALVGEAQSVASTANSKAAESAEQKRERLWGELDELNKKTFKGINELVDSGVMDAEEGEKWKDELSEIMAMPDSKEKADRLEKFYQQYGDRLQEIMDSLPPDDPGRALVQRKIEETQQAKGTTDALNKNEANRTAPPQNLAAATETVAIRSAIPDLQAAGVTNASVGATNNNLPTRIPSQSINII